MPIIKIKTFNEKTAKQFELALKELMKYKPIAIILDLRNNPGGLLEPAIGVASILLPKDATIIQIYYKNNATDSITTHSNMLIKQYVNIPIIVLINKGSASASEVLTAAIIENNKGIAIGETSFGKGVIQDIIPLKSIPGTAIKLTVAKYKTPKGNEIDKVGIKPEIECGKDCDIIRTAEKAIASYY